MSQEACIDVTRSGHVARIELRQPARRNAMRYSMWCELAQTMDTLAGDETVRVVVVTGAGQSAFCAGADISEFGEWRTTPDKSALYDQATHRACAALGGFPKPTIARVHGYCIGGGFELALLCDIRVCADDARFAVTPARLGLGYDLDDTRLLVSRLGATATRELLFTGRLFEPDEALRLGIVNRVVASDALDQAVGAYTREIAANAPLTIRAAKAIIAEAEKVRSERDEALCRRLVDACYASEDYAEGRRAFAEKRRPVFKGR
jgi:enoyl-CoA hydratase/carnithine racemase